MIGRRYRNELDGLMSDLQSIDSQLAYVEVEKFKLKIQENVDDKLLRIDMSIKNYQKLKKDCESNIRIHRSIIRKRIDEKYKHKTLDDTITDIAIELEKESKYPRDKMILEALFIALKNSNNCFEELD